MSAKIDVHHHFVPEPYIDGEYNISGNIAPSSRLMISQHSAVQVETHRDGAFQHGAQTAVEP